MEKYSEISLSENINNQLFNDLSNRIKSEFNGKIEKDIFDTESKYRDFKIEDKRITLHENTFVGIMLFPTKLEEAEIDENLITEKIGFHLKYRKSNITTWVKMQPGGEYEINYLLENIQYCREEKSNYEFTTYEEYNGGCDNHDHCEICSTMISCKVPDKELYSSPRNIVCLDCYKKYIEEDDYLDKIERLEKFERSIKGMSKKENWMNKIKKIFKKK